MKKTIVTAAALAFLLAGCASQPGVPRETNGKLDVGGITLPNNLIVECVRMVDSRAGVECNWDTLYATYDGAMLDSKTYVYSITRQNGEKMFCITGLDSRSDISCQWDSNSER